MHASLRESLEGATLGTTQSIFCHVGNATLLRVTVANDKIQAARRRNRIESNVQRAQLATAVETTTTTTENDDDDDDSDCAPLPNRQPAPTTNRDENLRGGQETGPLAFGKKSLILWPSGSVLPKPLGELLAAGNGSQL
uniref:Uncharacterized protein n=1 Tax=Peronospora matthiolae TaxID=2874970 RepID=A0AAV1T8F5_9STRA